MQTTYVFKLVCDLSIGAISNDLERTLTLFSRSGHSLTLNISQTATDTRDGRATAIVTVVFKGRLLIGIRRKITEYVEIIVQIYNQFYMTSIEELRLM